MNIGIEIKLKQPDDFLKVKETLTRIGVASRKEKTLYQTCHLLHKRGQYYILHFKELFILDGKDSTLDNLDIARRNKIAALLDEWELVEVLDLEAIKENQAPLSQIKIISHREKSEWQLVEKYHVGKKRRTEADGTGDQSV